MRPGELVPLLAGHGDRQAIVGRSASCSYRELVELVRSMQDHLDRADIGFGTVVMAEGDFSAASVALLLALVERRAIIVPLSLVESSERSSRRATARVEATCRSEPAGRLVVERGEGDGRHPLYDVLRERGHGGLVLFSSGSSGQSKAVVHDLEALLDRYRAPRRPWRTAAVLLYDHIGGFNTLMFTLRNGGCLAWLDERTPDEVLAAVARHQLELLPTSPTFLSLMLASQAHARHDLTSLRRITYGTEPMPAKTLARLRLALPQVELSQTYGLSETGILQSKSLSSDSLWVRVGGEGFQTRVVNGLLEIKARSTMLGYLNAPSPLTADGWLRTGDRVEVQGEYLKILGRESDLINVGGRKVDPGEVESVVLDMEGVDEVAVWGEANPLLGQVVVATVRLATNESLADFRRRLYRHCRGRLAPHKIPQKVVLSQQPLHGARFKKRRQASGT